MATALVRATSLGRAVSLGPLWRPHAAALRATWRSAASASYPGYPSRSLPTNTVIKFVPQQEAWIIERFGKFNRILQPGLNFLVPFIDQVKYVQSLKEIVLTIPSQSAVTNDNVTLNLDGVLFLRIVNPYKASYGVESAGFAVAQLAQTTMRSEIGKMMLDQTFKERDKLNQAIVQSMQDATASWGIECLRYEIRDILLPDDILRAMQMQGSAERRKRAQILDSEGARQAEVNIAEGRRQATVLASEAVMLEKMNIAKGEAASITARAEATAESIRRISNAIAEGTKTNEAMALTVAEKYIDAFANLAKEGNTLLLPAGISDPANFIAQAMSIVQTVNRRPLGPEHHQAQLGSGKAPTTPASVASSSGGAA